jgi:hypothetical protein
MKNKDITPYNENGKRHGYWEQYWSDGQLFYKGFFDMGKRVSYNPDEPMEKFLVKIEFRYSDAPKDENYGTSKTKTITIGVYDSFGEACLNGNILLEKLESKFELHSFPSGVKAKKDRFSKNGGCFGTKNTLITNLAYLKTPFDFFAKIETLKYDSIDDSIDDVLQSVKRYRDYKITQEDI